MCIYKSAAKVLLFYKYSFLIFYDKVDRIRNLCLFNLFRR